MMSKVLRNVACKKYKILEAMEQEEKLCDEVETVSKFTYPGDKVSAGGGCEAAVTARTRCGWVKPRECGELLYGNGFPLRLKGAIYKSYVRSTILYGRCWNERGYLQELCKVNNTVWKGLE